MISCIIPIFGNSSPFLVRGSNKISEIRTGRHEMLTNFGRKYELSDSGSSVPIENDPSNRRKPPGIPGSSLRPSWRISNSSSPPTASTSTRRISKQSAKAHLHGKPTPSKRKPLPADLNVPPKERKRNAIWCGPNAHLKQAPPRKSPKDQPSKFTAWTRRER